MSASASGNGLKRPVTGIEAEFVVRVDGERVDPERRWSSPSTLMGPSVLEAAGPSAPLPGGGVLYFDQGVIEVVTPVIELGPGAATRVTRNLWEQIDHVRARLDAWGAAQGRDVRLQGFSTHYNVSFEAPERPDPTRTVEKLALLLAHLLPMPVALLGGNRRSTGIGVRPRGNRIEVTADFTPDPGLMVATAAMVVGVVRGAMALPSYELSTLSELPLPTVDGVVPGKHSSRSGWLLRDYHYPRSPFTASVDARLWPTRDGRRLSLRGIARETAWRFRRSLRQHSDPFSFRLLFSVLEGRWPSLLELPDRPAAYDDVGRACRWGEVLPPLRARPAGGRWSIVDAAAWSPGSFEAHVLARARARARYRRRVAREAHRAGAERIRAASVPPPASTPVRPSNRVSGAASGPPPAAYRGWDRRGGWPGPPAIDRTEDDVDRRRRPGVLEQRIRGGRAAEVSFAEGHLTRSTYEQVFLRLVAGTSVSLAGEIYRPTRMRGWYHAVFRRQGDGGERLLSIDELLSPDVKWLDTPSPSGRA